MCDLDRRCASHTRGPHKGSIRNYYAAQGRLAKCVPDVTPIASVEATYAHASTLGPQTAPAPKAATVSGQHMSVSALTGDAARHVTPGHVAASAAGHRASASSAMAALNHMRQAGNGPDMLRDPIRSRAAAQSCSGLGRVTGGTAVAALAHARSQAPAPVARLRDPEMAQRVSVTHAAGSRYAASGAVSALSALRAKGWSNPHAGVALA